MYFLFLGLWFVFHGKITVEITVFAMVISGLMCAFCVRFLGYNPKKEWHIVKTLPKRLAYVFLMVKEIAVSNLQLTKIVLSKKQPHPVLVQFRTPIKGVAAKATLCNSITLTPGTITVSVDDQTMLVHCLDQSFAKGIQQTPMQQALLEMEETT